MTYLRPRLQRWDLATLPRVHDFIANSENVRGRIQRLYKRDSKVIYPPVDYDFYSTPSLHPLPEEREPFYLIVSALAPYKRVDIAIEAFRRMKKKLVVIGEGQEGRRLRESAGPRIEFRGWLTNAELRAYYQKCRGLLFPAKRISESCLWKRCRPAVR